LAAGAVCKLYHRYQQHDVSHLEVFAP